ncbi:hypothetical protein H920_19553 [Fukomys damarensis]|uniref:Uncharacterized protein n=1 Tax=Fukomys damarensis TaxID=885580 RepID=A0A091CPG9_FUKDA|nr:hypothetical protein H920_19553 [Fukomys damarensis]
MMSHISRDVIPALIPSDAAPCDISPCSDTLKGLQHPQIAEHVQNLASSAPQDGGTVHADSNPPQPRARLLQAGATYTATQGGDTTPPSPLPLPWRQRQSQVRATLLAAIVLRVTTSGPNGKPST